MKNPIYTIIIIMCAFVLASCGDQHKATSVVDDFLKTNLRNTEFRSETISFDSTKNISDKAISQMRTTAQEDPIFKANIQWGKRTSRKLFYTRQLLIQGNDSAVRTFYLDPQLKEIIALKMN